MFRSMVVWNPNTKFGREQLAKQREMTAAEADAWDRLAEARRNGAPPLDLTTASANGNGGPVNIDLTFNSTPATKDGRTISAATGQTVKAAMNQIIKARRACKKAVKTLTPTGSTSSSNNKVAGDPTNQVGPMPPSNNPSWGRKKRMKTARKLVKKAMACKEQALGALKALLDQTADGKAAAPEPTPPTEPTLAACITIILGALAKGQVSDADVQRLWAECKKARRKKKKSAERKRYTETAALLGVAG